MAPQPIAMQAVLDGARRALETHGWQGATMERIAEAAGVSRVTLHRHGLSKESILAELASQATDRYREAIWPALTGPQPATERLRMGLEILCAQAEENMALLVALDAAANATVFHTDGEQALTRTVFTEPLERLLRDGAGEGSVSALEDAAETATVLFNLVGWTYIHLRTGHGWPPDRARDATLRIAMDGVTGTERGPDRG